MTAADPLPRLSRRALLLAAVGFAAGCSQTTKAKSATTAGTSVPPGSTPRLVLPQESPTTTSALAPVRSVGMVGDSITVRSKPALTSVFASKGIADVVIDAEVSRRIEVGSGKGGEPLNGEQALTNLLKKGHDPDVWVFALGTNDVNKVGTAGYATLIDSMLMMPPAATPVVWVDVYWPAALAQTKSFNDVLRSRAAARPHTSVASWFAVASDKKKRLLSSDDLHPNEAGEAAFAALVGAAVSAAA